MKWIVLALVLLSIVIWINVSKAADLPSVGQVAPDFALQDQSGQTQKLSSYRGKWVVLYFYPKDDTPHCTTEACQFRDDIVQIHALGAEVLGVSVDDTDSHAAFASKHSLSFPLLADKGGVVAAQYGSISDFLLIKFAKRNTFIINPQGQIAKVYTAVEAKNHAQIVVHDLTALIAK